MNTLSLTVTVNGKVINREIPADRTLLRFLREDLGLTGTKEGCGEGECGACTVLLDGKPVCSCIMLAAQADGHSVTTIEGLAYPDGRLHPVQEAFIRAGAVQCGFCTPGMVLAAAAALEAGTLRSHEDAKVALAGNLCRCTGYAKIFDAVVGKGGQGEESR